MNEEINIQKSSGNVFSDLGLANPDELLVKAELARKISRIITQNNIAQAGGTHLKLS